MKAGDTMDVDRMSSRRIRRFDDTDRAFFAGDERQEEIGQTRRELTIEQFPGQAFCGVECIMHTREVLCIVVIFGEEDQCPAIASLR